jgi:dolichol-phosphate mannosyltransferase
MPLTPIPRFDGRLSVIVPVKNEEDNLEPLIIEIIDALGPHGANLETFEIIYVDDGSSDGSYKCLSALSETISCLRVLKHQTSFGQSAAVHSGVQAARFPWISTLDGDGQNDPADLPRMIACLQTAQATNSALVAVCGHRVKRHDDWLRRASSRVANNVRAAILGDETPDSGCGLKLFARDAFLELPFFNHLHRFLPALFRRQQRDVVSLPVNHRPRMRGRSNYGLNSRLWVGLFDLAGVWWLNQRMKIPVLEETSLSDKQTRPPSWHA